MLFKIEFEYECADGCGTSWEWIKDVKFYEDYNKYIKEFYYMKSSSRYRHVR